MEARRANFKTGVSRKQSMPNFLKNEHFLSPDTHTYVCVSGGKKCSFFGKFGVLCFLETLVWRFALLLYCRRLVYKSTRKRCEICLKLTIKTPEWRHWARSSLFIVNLEHVSYLFLVYILLTLNKQMLTAIAGYSSYQAIINYSEKKIEHIDT